MGWFNGSSSTVSGSGWVRKRSPHRSNSVYSSRHSRHSAPSIFSFGGGSKNRSTSSFFSTSSYSRKGVRPRSGFIERMIRRIKRLLRDIWSYGRRNPIKVFLFVIVPLITGGVLQKLLAMVGLRLPGGLVGNREFEQISRRGTSVDWPELPLRERLFNQLMREIDNVDEIAYNQIMSGEISISQIFRAGLRHTPARTPQNPSSNDTFLIDESTVTLRTDRILVPENGMRVHAYALPNVYANNLRLKQFTTICALRASIEAVGLDFSMLSNPETESPFYRGSLSKDAAEMIITKEGFDNVVPHLRPTIAQIRRRHHPYLDALPFPTLRERIIEACSLESPILDEEDLCEDLKKDGLICWGSYLGDGNRATGSGAPWDFRSWEAQPWFLRKWWFFIGGSQGELFQQTRWWHEMRGDRLVAPCLGQSGLKISKVVFGAMSLGSSDHLQWAIPESEALPILKHAFDLGINTWDTSDVYSFGESERIIGKALKHYDIARGRVVILTKCYGGIPEPADFVGRSDEERLRMLSVNDGIMVNRIGLSRKHIFDAVDASVERLGTYIDVLQIHRLDRNTPREEIMKALNDVVESGKVRYIGASSMHAWEFQALNNIADKHGWHKFISMQDYHSLLYREEEREMHAYCRDAGVGIIPWSPLARGLLARPYKVTQEQPTVRQTSDVYSRFLVGEVTEADVKIINRVEELAERKHCSMAQIAIAWSLKKGVNPIVGLASAKRVDEAAEAVALASKGLLTDEEVKSLDELYVAKPEIFMVE
ncbi:hypothetical protein TCE0_022r06292 [Talaromyces pinophilus]|uniref:NADP-dependent oxidoreductase domain-containing protein n=1 Tax=Talaromyces pinophilus TaxID=128442 RepID=A0A6V8H9R6_TALPI|nr:hypothetical protein TCE0_022r06292 [Talaromyces pinophilus]